MPSDGRDWPTLDSMVQQNFRLVVFTSKSAKQATEGIAYEWKYLVENQCELSLTLMSSGLEFSIDPCMKVNQLWSDFYFE